MGSGYRALVDLATFEAHGLYDPDAPDASERRVLLEHLAARGATIEEMVAADAEGRLPFVLGDRLISPGRPTMTVREAAARVGVSPDLVRWCHRAVGLSAPGGGEPAFAEADLVTLELLAASTAEFGEEATTELARVIGASLGRIAEAGFAASLVHVPGGYLGTAESIVAAADATERLGTIVRAIGPLFDVLFRRHVEATVRRWVFDGSADPDAPVLAVGFADLVGFSTISQQMDRPMLSRAIAALEDLANEVVTGHGGRIVKFIGDEVMYLTPDAPTACRIALRLFAAEHELLPMLRASVALGPVLQRGGDAFGPVVNVAARLVEQARAGELLVTADTARELDPVEFSVAPLAPMTLKGFAEPVPTAAVAQGRGDGVDGVPAGTTSTR